MDKSYYKNNTKLPNSQGNLATSCFYQYNVIQEDSFMKKRLIIILSIAALLVLGFVATQFLKTGKDTILNTGYVNGNTASNLYNGGAF